MFAPAPFLLKDTSVSVVMTQVCIALVPGIAAYAWLVGPAILVQLVIATLAALLAEAGLSEKDVKLVLLQHQDGRTALERGDGEVELGVRLALAVPGHQFVERALEVRSGERRERAVLQEHRVPREQRRHEIHAPTPDLHRYGVDCRGDRHRERDQALGAQVALVLLDQRRLVVGDLVGQPDAHPGRDLDVLRQAAVAMENARLFQQTQSALQERDEFSQLLARQGWQGYLGQARGGR